jgi:hypothetical protein
MGVIVAAMLPVFFGGHTILVMENSKRATFEFIINLSYNSTVWVVSKVSVPIIDKLRAFAGWMHKDDRV